MTTAREFRQYADECLRWASETKDEEQRQQFLDMASAWVQAASLQDGKLPSVLRAAPSVAPQLSSRRAATPVAE